MQYINLTPHEVKIFGSDPATGKPTADPVLVLAPSGQVARIVVEDVRLPATGGIEHYTSIPGDPEGLPEPVPGVMFVVSAIVRLALPDRWDLASPGRLVRHEAGQPIGCIGLYVNR